MKTLIAKLTILIIEISEDMLETLCITFSKPGKTDRQCFTKYKTNGRDQVGINTSKSVKAF